MDRMHARAARLPISACPTVALMAALGTGPSMATRGTPGR